MRSLRWLMLLGFTAFAACGSDSTADSGNGTIDAPIVGDDTGTPIVDAGTADLPSSLGDLCATTAPDGSPAACTGGTICCTSTAGTYCTLPDDCPTGGGFVSCTMTSDCFGGRICCQAPGMTFCTKADACEAYGGTILP
jgi:hypothetical protein